MEDERPQEPQTPITDDSLDDRERLKRLFGIVEPSTKRPDAPPHVPSAGLRPSTKPRTVPDGNEDGWPRHNYNAAYQSVRQQHPRRRRAPPRDESELWEINALLDPPAAPAPETFQPTPRAPASWPDHRPLFDPLPTTIPDPEHPEANQPEPTNPDMDTWNHEGWLERLADNKPGPRTTTEARLVRTLWGDPAHVRAPLFEASQTLYARAPGQSTPIPTSAVAETADAPAAHATKPRTRRFAIPPKMRSFALRAAGILLGLKIGLSVGYAAAFLL